jgi:hypothetical protein
MTIDLHEQDSNGKGWHHVWTGSLVDFARDNELEQADTFDIAECLLDAGQYYGGGGASPEYKLVLVPGEES